MGRIGLLGCVAILVVVVIIFGIFAMSTYNKLVQLEEGVKAQWANVESAYQRRLDLIPNLVATVQGAATIERDTLEAVVNARARATQVMPAAGTAPDNPQAFAQFEAAQTQVSSALSRLLLVVEQYPQLRSQERFGDLMNQLEGTENRINVERNRYNQLAQAFNSAVRRFPGNLIARMMGFTAKEYFKATPGAEQAPPVTFDFKK
jgi:LemA protein